ncbi:DUF2325 domain-containing protein [uncultured Massilia sp.]|uniref:DUF2325 domain-containing protein n=1 Tax=uncultured Massilia sp. TaxID=169973 RepID=UPI0025DC51BC|nr:DUF2325 domain-containing protein [uncultured Massilia sp.]
MCDHARSPSARHDDACGSRRRRLWELPTNCHCPIIGVCLPLALLRKLVGKAAATPVQGDDYDLHVWSVHECGNRSRMADLLQRTLDERFAGVIRQFKGARDGDALLALWRRAMDSGDTAGAFWAALSHPRCDAWMTESIVRDMHMIQHQAGASVRVDIGRFAELQRQNALLAAELEQTRDKAARAAEARAKDAARTTEQAAQLRAELAQRDTAIEALRRQRDALEAALPDMRDRERLLRRVEELEARERALADRLAQLRQRAARARQEAAAHPPPPPAPAAPRTPVVVPIALADKTVLCVGGRSANVPNYRELLEKEGARFMHHDGGIEQASELLDTSLAAADLVICQTGCISHQAYWRVKDFCKRTGKRCLFVDNPSTSSLSSCLRKVAEAAPALD